MRLILEFAAALSEADAPFFRSRTPYASLFDAFLRG
jgi:hypothetical protein